MNFKTFTLINLSLLSIFYSCAKAQEVLPEDASDSKTKTAVKKTHKNFIPVFTSAVTGGILGTPVEIARHSKEEVISGQRDLCGQFNNPMVKVVATSISLPFGVLSGVLQAPVWSFYNSIKYSQSKPFSKETFSIDTN